MARQWFNVWFDLPASVDLEDFTFDLEDKLDALYPSCEVEVELVGSVDDWAPGSTDPTDDLF